MVFISDRNDGVAQLFVVPLARQTEDPNDPLVRERLQKARGARRPRGGRGAGATSRRVQRRRRAEPGARAGAVTALTVDTDRIDRRAVR